MCFSVKTTVTMILECVFHHHKYFTPSGETFYMHEKSCAFGTAQLKEDGPLKLLAKNPVLPDKLWQKEMKLFACGTCLKPNSRGTPLPASPHLAELHLLRDLSCYCIFWLLGSFLKQASHLTGILLCNCRASQWTL